MKGKELKKLLKDVALGRMTTEAAQKKIEKVAREERIRAQEVDSSGCRY